MQFTRDFVQRCAASYPNKIAYWDGDRSASWPQMHQRSDQFAAAMQGLGVEKGDAVAILSHEHIEVYEHWFACSKIGALRTGINWRFAPREMRHVIDDAECKLVLIEANCVELLAEHVDALIEAGVKLVGYGGEHSLPYDYEALLADVTEPPVLPALADDDLVCYSYTSGTTGLPKGVMLTQKGMREAIVNTVLCIGLRFEDVWFPPTASAWITFVLGSMNLANGMTVVLPNGDFESHKFLDFIGRYRVTSTIVVPTMLQRLLIDYEAGDYDMSSMRLITYGSSPARASLIRKTLELFDCELMQLYGLTESTGGWVSFLRHEDHLRGLAEKPELLASCGQAGPHMEITIRDGDGDILPANETGEVWMRSDTNMLGYLNLPEQTAEALHDGWLCTNDLGKLDEEGYLYLTDRKNYLIITGAANVFPSVVESALSEHPAVREVAVLGAPHPEWGEAVVAGVALHAGKQVSSDELIEFCRDKVAKWEVPKFIEIVDELPKGPTGKVLKKVLQQRYRTETDLLPWSVETD
ncbi:MAG TPA: CoA ligase [Gammaproteobacteria bacterium]|nr:CoA ligase [Gammaproteobacteria bacterium]